MADEGHDHSAPNDRQHIAQHVGEMFRQLVQLRGLPVFLIYQEENFHEPVGQSWRPRTGCPC